MWTETKTLLTLDEWATIIGINPWVLSQVIEPRTSILQAVSEGTRVETCARAFFQSFRSTGALTREEIAIAISQAESLISSVARTWPAPYEDQETIRYPRHGDLKAVQLWYGPSNRIKPVQMPYSHIISTGRYTEELVEAGRPVVGSDPMTDGFNTRFTVTVTVEAGTQEDELKVYFPVSDYFELDRADLEIRPVDVSISGLTATISGPLYLLITVDNYLKLRPIELNAQDAIYATTVDVYRETIDLTQSGSLIWENSTYAFGDCTDPPCTFEASSACFTATDPQRGWISPVPASFDNSLQTFSRLFPENAYAPDKILVNYISGINRVNRRLAYPWNRIVALLATALLPQRSSGCDRADQRIHTYRSLQQDDNNNLEVTSESIFAASRLFGVAGRGAVEAAHLLNNQELISYRGVHV